jgi:cell pole-organizing protein PopZ
MAEQTAEQEPTMEEILASIRRIISEDDEAEGQTAEAAPEPETAPQEEPAPEPEAAEPAPELEPEPEPEPEAAPEEEVLELTERVEEPEPVQEVEDDIAIVDSEPEPAPEPMPEPEPEPVAELDMSDSAEEDLVSEPVANAAASAFGDLVGQMLVSSRSTEGKTLEDIVRELMKPMLREWLDANLRSIVEAKVADEVERISSRARR